MVAPTVNFQFTAIAAQIGQSSSGNNAASAPTYPGVTSSSLQTRTDSFWTLPQVSGDFGRSARFDSAGGFSTARFEGGGWDISTLDMSNGLIVMHLLLIATAMGGIGLASEDGFVIALRSGSGNWRRWSMGGRDISSAAYPHIQPSTYYPLVLNPSLPGDFADDGTYDVTAIDRIELHIYRTSSSSYSIAADECFFFQSLAINDGDGTTPANLTFISDYFDPNQAADENALVFLRSGTNFYYSYLPFAINATNIDDSFTVEFAEGGAGQPTIRYATGDKSLNVTAGAGSTLALASCKLQSLADYDAAFSIDATATTDISSLFIDNANTVTLGDNFDLTAGVFSNISTLNADDASISSVSLLNIDRIEINSGTSFNAETLSGTSATGVVFVGAPGNYSTLDLTYQAALDFSIDPDSAGTFNLSGLKTTGAGDITFNNLSGTDAITVEVESGVTTTQGTVGGGLTITQPAQTFNLGVSDAPIGSAIGIFQAIGNNPKIANRSQFTLATGNTAGNGALTINESIPADTPSAGFVRILRDDGITEDRLAFVSWTGSVVTLSGTLPVSYSSGNSAYIGYLDILGTVTGNESEALEYVEDRNCVLSVRLGSGNPVEPIRQPFIRGNSDLIIPISTGTDIVNNR